MDKDNYKIAAVVVTYNRLEFLKECVKSIRKQSRKLDEIIVINNSSTDGTLEWLAEQNDLTVITQGNSGSAGGQYIGIKTAYEKGYDWVWCMDCDIVQEFNSLDALMGIEEFNDKSTGFVSGTIYFADGNLAHPNIPELAHPYSVLNSVAKKKAIPVISSSFGSVIFPRYIIEKVGLPSKDFFIWGDDAEYSLRIIQKGFSGYMVLESKAQHLDKHNNPLPFKSLSVSEQKFVYGIRNMVYIAIFRNKIVFNSYTRGFLSGLAFIIRIYYQRKKNETSRIRLIFVLITHFIKGVTFNPKIEYVK